MNEVKMYSYVTCTKGSVAFPLHNGNLETHSQSCEMLPNSRYLHTG